MKKTIVYVIIVLLALPVVSFSESIFEAQKRKNQNMVNTQKKEDIERKEALLRKMRAFIGEINGRLKQSGDKTQRS